MTHDLAEAGHPASDSNRGDTSAEPTEQQAIWQYMLDHIDDFAVAKSIVDHFDAHPAHLGKADIAEIDLIGVYVRARVTLKREQVAYAEAQRALTRARESSRGLGGLLRSLSSFTRSVREASAAHSAAIAALVCMTAIWLLR